MLRRLPMLSLLDKPKNKQEEKRRMPRELPPLRLELLRLRESKLS